MFGNSIARDLFVLLRCGFRVREGSIRDNKSELVDVLHSACRALMRFAAVVLSGSLVSGCLATLQGDPDRLYPVQYEMDVARQILPDLESQYYGAASEQQRQSIRNDIIARRMYIIDAQYSVYEASLTRENQEVSFAADAASLGLNTAGTLVTPAATTRILGGIAGAVIGVKGNYESDIVIAKTVQIIQAQMRANRDNVAARILRNMGQSTAAYPFSLALTDLEAYYRAGTLTAGLIQAADVIGTNAIQVEASKPETVIVNTTFSADVATAALKKFMFPNGIAAGPNKANVSRLNALLADSRKFQQAPDGKPFIAQQILFGQSTAALRLQLARAAGLFQAAGVGGSNAIQVKSSKPGTVISNTTFSADAATAALQNFMFPNGRAAGANKENVSRLNELLADSGKFQQAPDGKPFIVQQILFGPEKAALRLQLARAAGLFP